MDTDYPDSVKFPVQELNVEGVETSTDIHPHTSYTDGSQEVQHSVEEGLEYGFWEKGAIEHGNPLDEDIDHMASFLDNWEGAEPYSSTEVYTFKYMNLRELMEDSDEGEVLNQADPEKLKEDIETLKQLERYGSHTGEEALNYKMVIPHGVELDYNPAIELDEDGQEAVDSYEEGLIDFLKEAESLNAGFNYILASSHYVNTPFQPRYVKEDELFQEMGLLEKIGVLEAYRKKEIQKIQSLSEKLEEMEVPRISDELMDQEEREELKAFIYGQEINDEISGEEVAELSGRELEAERPGVMVVGAHPTLIERNEELMDVFRAEEGLTKREDIAENLDDFIYGTEISGSEGRVDLSEIHGGEVSQEQIDEILTDEDFRHIYPGLALQEYYRPVIEASEGSDNFVFEVNGKGVERQASSVFWYMLDENVFGSDAHRPMESPERAEAYSESGNPGKTVLLTERWLEQLGDSEEVSELEDEGLTDMRSRIEASEITEPL